MARSILLRLLSPLSPPSRKSPEPALSRKNDHSMTYPPTPRYWYPAPEEEKPVIEQSRQEILRIWALSFVEQLPATQGSLVLW